MKIWHISDTHGYHHLLTIPEDIDTIVFSGDCANYRDPFTNEVEVIGFLNWFESLKIKNKIMIAGNHDSSIEKGLIKKKDIEARGIIYLFNESTEVDGVKFWGSPITPEFGGWSFMMKRSNTNKLWQTIPEDTDVVITHGPPKGVLDLSYTREHVLETCGDSALMKRINIIEPKLMLFGHIHDNEDIVNQGTRQLANLRTVFSNGSVVKDRHFGRLSSNGNVLYV